MENFGGTGFSDLSKTTRKKRSNRPRSNAQLVRDIDNSPLSSLPLSDNGSKASSDDNTGNFTNSQRKELNLNQCNAKALLTNTGETEMTLKISDEDGQFEGFSEVGIEGINENKDSVVGMGNNNNKLKRFKLKLGGVTRTLHAPVGDSSQSDATLPRQKLIIQEDSDEAISPNPNKRSNLRGVPWKDFSRSGFIGQKASSSRRKISDENVRKSKRVPKKKLLDGALRDEDDGDEDDEEIRFLEKLKNPRLVTDYGAEEDDESGTTKHRRISRVLNRTRDGGDAGDYRSSTSIKEIKKSMSSRVSDDNDYIEDDDDPMSDVDMENKRKKQRKEFSDVAVASSKEMAVTTRQRAHLQTVKDPLSGPGSSLIEFQKGLPPAPSKKQKEKLSDVEQQLKKAEAAQKRRMQVEKAARESEAEAIRKILGQDSSRKKREDKIKKRQEELAQERSTNVMTLAANTVRWNMGPTGTVVTFPNDMGLPSILEPKPCCYPPPREKCAGPSCENPYKYRDSKYRLPLCSLQCYKAIHVD